MKTLVPFQEALETIFAAVPSMAPVAVDLEESFGRILAEQVKAPEDIPPFERASMDGYAVHAATRSVGPQIRTVIGELQAGSVFHGSVDERSAIRIMTGAALPPGANAVIEQELASEESGTVRYEAVILPGRNIRSRGEDLRKGDLALPKGTFLSPASVGLLASIGRKSVTVARRPTIDVLVTGSELLDVNDESEPGKIRESNSWVLRAALHMLGLPPRSVVSVADDPNVIASALEKAISADALILSGGVSVGKHDYVREALSEVGVQLLFWKVQMKPGMPFAFGLGRRDLRTIPVFALPGNPVSTFVTFRLLVQPGLERMQGRTATDEGPTLRAVLGNRLSKQDEKRHFVRGIVRSGGAELQVEPYRKQSSGVLSSLSGSNCLIVLPEEARTVQPGESVDVILL